MSSSNGVGHNGIGHQKIRSQYGNCSCSCHFVPGHSHPVTPCCGPGSVGWDPRKSLTTSEEEDEKIKAKYEPELQALAAQVARRRDSW